MVFPFVCVPKVQWASKIPPSATASTVTSLRQTFTYFYPSLFLTITTAPHAGANTRLQLLLENSKSKKGQNCVKIFLGLPAILVWVPLLIVNN